MSRRRHPVEVWEKFVELDLPLERWGWFLGTTFAYDNDRGLLEILEKPAVPSSDDLPEEAPSGS